MLITVNVKRTIQEVQYEPIDVSIGLQHEFEGTKDEVLKMTSKLELAVEELVDEVMERRIKRSEELYGDR